MAYLVTARKYRPKTFEELVGQEHIAKTLQNAVKRGKIGHAYLFSGMRGVGKTSTARILAKALNCEHGPTPTPCNKCRFCREINEGSSLDLIEIDGASNRGIDRIRELRENVRFVPSSARYKIYIIDEVHMLTTEAFNALLKTLEEPPEHVVFIFATTELHKVPSTIKSRCQQFVFKAIPTNLIVDNLRRILGDLKIDYDQNALFWIAKSATGSMRDAESMLDQVISYSEGRITVEDVLAVLGLPGYEVYHRIAEGVRDGNFRECFEIIDELIGQGIDVETIISGLIEYFRNMYLLKFGDSSSSVIDLPGEDMQRMREISGGFSPRDISNILLLLSRLYSDAKNSEIARYLFEISMIKMVNYRDIIHPSEILKRLEALEGRLRGPDKVVDSAPSNIGYARETAGSKKSEANSTAGNGGAVSVAGGKGELFEKIVKTLRFKRRALAEFLDKAHRCSYEGDKIRIYFDRSQRLGYEHVNEEQARMILLKEVEEIVGKKIQIDFVLEDNGKKDEAQDEELTPQVEKILQIFKGEIISNKEDGGS